MVSVGKNLNIGMLLDFYGQMLTDKQKDAVDFYYNQDFSLAEIAEEMSISRQGARDLIKRAEKQLLDFEESLGLVARFSRITEELLQISECCENIKKLTEDSEICKNIDTINDFVNKITDKI